MDFTGVYHKASEQMCYPLNEDELIVNLKTGYDVKRVFIYYGDPFEAGILGGKEQWAGKKEEICFKKHLRHHLWWTTTLTPRFKRCKYYFELHTEEETWYYFENGFLSEEQIGMEGRMLQCFVMPWMNPADVNSTPDWVNDTVWYQIFPDRFCNGTPEKNGADIEKWRTGPVSNAERFGGNLEGIRKKLPYLHDLGISGIYLNPIMEAESTHKYDTRDGRFYSFAFTDRMPKLNTNNPEVIRYFCQVCKRWIREFDIDGIRFDVGNEVSHRFLKELRRQLKSVKPDLYLLGEIWHDASQWLGGDEYDSVMNYPLTSGIQDFFLDQAAEKDEFEYMVNRCYTMYMQQNNNVIFNLLDSHDTERLMNRCQDLDIFYQQLAILFTMPGSPCIYYGTEIALEGAHDPDCRRCMPWDEIDSAENQKKIELMKSLIRMRIQEDACRSLYFDFPHKYSQKRCVEYRKLNLDGKWIEVLLNCGSEPIEIQGQGEILFARRCEGNSLDVRGTLIRRLPSTV